MSKVINRGAAPVNCPLTGFLEICPCRRRRRAADSLELVRVEGGHERVLEGGVLHRLAQVGVHAPRGREDALDYGSSWPPHICSELN